MDENEKKYLYDMLESINSINDFIEGQRMFENYQSKKVSLNK